MGIRGTLLAALGDVPRIPDSSTTEHRVATYPYTDMWPTFPADNHLDRIAFDAAVMPDSDGPVTRAVAERVPAIAAGLQLFATLGTLPPIYRTTAGVSSPAPALLSTPDPDLPGAVHYARTYQDLLLCGRAYWVVIATAGGTDGTVPRPAQFRQVDAARVSFRNTDPPGTLRVDDDRHYTVARPGLPADLSTIVEFVGPLDGGILTAGAGAIRTALQLETAAQRFATVEVPTGVLKNTSGVDLTEPQIDALLTRWSNARANRQTAYLNPSLEYKPSQFDAAQLQLVEARREADARLAQLMGIPATYINAPSASGSQTYANLETRRRDLLDLTFSPYVAAVTGRLSLADLTPAGRTVGLDLSGFLRADLPTLVDLGTKAIAAGLMTVEEWRARAGMDTI